MTRIVAEAPNPVLAALWLDVLRRAGIPAYLADQQVGSSVYPGIFGGIKVVVRDEDYDKARRLLDEARAEAEAAGADDDAAEAADAEADDDEADDDEDLDGR